MVTTQHNLTDIAKLFFKLGTTAFGGPAVHIAMMREEVVVKRKWLAEQEYLDLIGATNLIPGPNSTELAIHIGYLKGGWRGLIVAGLCFILPAVIITGFFAWIYKEYGQVPNVQKLLYGLKPAIISIILAALLPLIAKAGKSAFLLLTGILAAIAVVAGMNELIVLFGCGFLSLFIHVITKKDKSKLKLAPLLTIKAGASVVKAMSNVKLFLLFLKIGAIIYGSGYVLFAFLDAELVENGYMSRQQLIDAIAVGQFTPGPVFSTVTFVGYQINGFSGALLATLGVFLPSFVFVAVLHLFMKKLTSAKWFSGFLDGVNIASVALIMVVCVQIGMESLRDWKTIIIAVCCLIMVFGFKKLNTVWTVLFGAVSGYILATF